MKTPGKKTHHIRKENQYQLRTEQRHNGLDVVAAQSSALQSELGLPSIRAVWAVIEDRKKEKAEMNRRQKR